MPRRSLLALPVLLAAALGTGTPEGVVLFAENAARLDASRATVATEANRTSAAPVRVLGFAGPRGGEAFNDALSEARAQPVAQVPRGSGMACSRIRVQPRGPVQPTSAIFGTEARRDGIVMGG